MLLFSLICTFRFPEHRVQYKGNYTLTRVIDNTTQITNSSFTFYFSENQTFCKTCSQLILKPNMTTLFKSYYLEMTGVYSSNLSSFFYFGTQDEKRTSTDSFRLINTAFNNLNVTGPYNHDLLAATIANYTKLIYSKAYCLAFNISENPHSISKYFTSDEATGKLYFLNNPNISLNFTARQFDEFKYVSEGKIFGLISSLSLYLSFQAWILLDNFFSSSAKLSQLSPDSYSMHVAFDFTFGIFLFNISDVNSHPTYLFSFLYALSMALYFIFDTPKLSEIWRASLDDFETAFRQNQHIRFFMKITLYIFLYSYFASVIFYFPVISILFLYSFFIPQIYFSTQTTARKSHDTIFNIIIAIARLIPLYYFTLYKDNLNESFSPGLAIFATIYVAIQIIIIYLQNTLGSCFFLPKSMQPHVFSYSDGVVPPDTTCPICMLPIESNEETMVTPCNHCFHKACLSRWMEEQLICPVCRARLPPLDDDSPQPQDDDQVIVI